MNDPAGVDLADPAVARVRDEEVALGVDLHVLRLEQAASQRRDAVPGVPAGRQPLGNRSGGNAGDRIDLAVRRLDLAHGAKATVGDEQVSGAVDSNPVRPPELDVPGVVALDAVVADRPTAGDGRDHPVGVDLADHPVRLVRNVEVALAVKSEARRAAVAEVRLRRRAAVPVVVGAVGERARAGERRRDAGGSDLHDAPVNADVEVPGRIEDVVGGLEERCIQARTAVADPAAGDRVDGSPAGGGAGRRLGGRRCGGRGCRRATGPGHRRRAQRCRRIGQPVRGGGDSLDDGRGIAGRRRSLAVRRSGGAR